MNFVKIRLSFYVNNMNSPRMKCFGIVIAILICLAASFGKESEDIYAVLKKAFNTVDAVERYSIDFLSLAVDYGDAAVPSLNKIFIGGNRHERARAGYFLALIADDAAISALYSAYKKGNEDLLQYLTVALSTRGSRSDISFLIDKIQDKNVIAWVKGQIFFALGVLRAKDAIPLLEEIATKDHWEMYRKTALEILEWINSKPVFVVINDIKPPNRDILSAIFANGIPRTRGISRIGDLSNRGIWTKTKDTWVFQKEFKEESLERFPHISYQIHVSPDSNRAIASITVVTGDRSEYHFILHKLKNSWKVRSLYLISD